VAPPLETPKDPQPRKTGFNSDEEWVMSDEEKDNGQDITQGYPSIRLPR
jgi:hypothetical protein